MHLTVTNPFDGQTVCELPYDTQETIDTKLTQARQAFDVWRKMSLSQRITKIESSLAKFRSESDNIARDVTLQMGKPIAQSRGEIDGFFLRAEKMISIAEEALSPDVLPQKPGFVRRVEHAPLGVVFNIAAWNYPLLTPVNVVIPALLAGNVVLLKHSAKTPLCGRHIAAAFEGIGPPGLVSDLIVTHKQTDQIIADPRVDHLSFTGSVDGGRQLYLGAAERLIDVGLELGGNDPAYVCQDADLEFTVENVVDGACYNAGQSCCAVERAYVHTSVYDEFLSRAQQTMAAYCLGDPMDDATTIGPLATRSAVDLLQRHVDDAVNRGARLLCGGKHRSGTQFYEPTLLADVPQEAAIMREESFGPILPVQCVSDDEEAVLRMNDSDLGLTASIWTTDSARAERIAAQLDAGTIYQNRCDYLDPALPWTGWKDSGSGSTLSPYGFHHLTRRKSVHFRTSVV